MKKVKVFVNKDLDGAGSLLILKWVIGENCTVDHKVSNVFNIDGDYRRFINSPESDEYAKIFILNMIPDFDIDDQTVVFSKATDYSRKFKGKLGKSTTTTKLMDEFFTKTDGLSDERREIIKAIDQFFTDGVTSRNGIVMNALFSYANNKYAKFYDRFDEGIGVLSEKEEGVVQNYVSSFVTVFRGIEMVEHTKHEGMFIVIVPDMKHKHELLNKIFDKHHPKKMVFLVDIEQGLVSVRKNDSYDFEMSNLCDKMIVGRSLINCAGGRFTEHFIEFTKMFH